MFKLVACSVISVVASDRVRPHVLLFCEDGAGAGVVVEVDNQRPLAFEIAKRVRSRDLIVFSYLLESDCAVPLGSGMLFDFHGYHVRDIQSVVQEHLPVQPEDKLEDVGHILSRIDELLYR